MIFLSLIQTALPSDICPVRSVISCSIRILMLSSKSTTSEYLYHTFALHDLKLLPEVELNSNDLVYGSARIGLWYCLYSGLYVEPGRFAETDSHDRGLPSRQLIMVQNDTCRFPRRLNDFLSYSHNVKSPDNHQRISIL